MKVDVAVHTDALLREHHDTRLFELYHENSKLFPDTARAIFLQPRVGVGTERYLATRGFRQYASIARVPLDTTLSSSTSLQDILWRRRSNRELSGAVALDELATLLQQSLGCTAIVEDSESELVHALRAWPSAGGLYPLDAYILSSNVSDLADGLYHFNPIARELERLPSRGPREILADAFFAQAFATNAAITIFLVAAFERTSAKYGERAYRLVMLDAGHAAQNLLLTAEQLGLNAVAVAGFCDDSVARDLGLDGISEAAVHAILTGRAA